MTHKQNRSQKSQIAQLNCFKRQDVRHKHPNNTFFGDLAAMQSFYGCERWPRSTSENLNRCVQPRNESLLDPLAWIKSMIYGRCKEYMLQKFSNFNTSYFVCCQDVVETPSSEPTDPVSRSARPEASDVLCQKKSRNVSKMQTHKRLIRNRVKNVITIDASNKSKAFHFVKNLPGYIHIQ